jgi:putative hemolysin
MNKIQNPLVIVSGFFAGSETALIRIGRIKARSLREKDVEGAKTVQKLVDDPKALLTTMIIGNDIVNNEKN